MNKKNLLFKRNIVKNLIRISNRNRNCLKWNSIETDSHINMKLNICKYLKQRSIEFYTEAIFEKGDRADIVVSDWERIIEVVESESKESIELKRKKYPLPLTVVNADQEFNEKLIL